MKKYCVREYVDIAIVNNLFPPNKKRNYARELIEDHRRQVAQIEHNENTIKGLRSLEDRYVRASLRMRFLPSFLRNFLLGF